MTRVSRSTLVAALTEVALTMVSFVDMLDLDLADTFDLTDYLIA
jgi:hypothetical protein